MRDQHLRLRVFEHVDHFFRAAVPVERHAIGADRGGGLLYFEEGEVVAQQQGDGVAFAHAELLEARGCLLRHAQHLVARHAAAVEVDHGGDAHRCRSQRRAAARRAAWASASPNIWSSTWMRRR
jgi:hypothetical protein